jgi:prepilin-type N-terminal cleavage/methylation domain-containing protein
MKPDRDSARSGFTILEMLLVIVIVAVLMSLLVVGLRGSRSAGRAAVTLSNLRQHAQVFSMYGESWDDAFPHFAETDRYTTITEFERLGVTLELPYFGQFFAWSWFLADDWYQGQFSHGSFADPSSEARTVYSDYYYGCCFVAGPEYWRETTRLGDFSQWRSTRWHEVVWPSQKVLLVYPAVASEQNARVALIDGSATTRDKRESFGKGYPYGDGQHPGSLHPGDVWQFLHTMDGVRGHDLD